MTGDKVILYIEDVDLNAHGKARITDKWVILYIEDVDLNYFKLLTLL